jgi:hypothetical protein
MKKNIALLVILVMAGFFTPTMDTLALEIPMTGLSGLVRDCDFLFTKVLRQRCNITLTGIISLRRMSRHERTQNSFFCWVTSLKTRKTREAGPG